MENDVALAIKIAHDGGSPNAARVALEGSLDTATSPELEAALDKLLAGPVRIKVVAFDLAGLKFISSAGIRVFMKARKELGDRGGSLALNNLQPQIAKVLEIVKSLPGVSIFSDERELDAYLAAMQRKVLEERP
jgi:anti-anti-sigma factor